MQSMKTIKYIHSKNLFVFDIYIKSHVFGSGALVMASMNIKNTVYRKNFAPVLFSPFWPSNPRANLKLGLLNDV